MAEQKFPCNWKSCGTCARWCGKQTPDLSGNLVSYDPFERARCAGGGFNGAQTSGQATCNKWEQRFKKR